MPESRDGTSMERSHAMIKTVVIGLGAAIVLLTGLLIAGIVDRVDETTIADDFRDVAVPLPAGARAASVTSDAETLTLLLDLPSGSQAILTVDRKTGEILGTLELIPRP